jgi:hypothetical protein
MKNSSRKDITEKKVETGLREGVEELQGMCVKLHTVTFTGLPDRLVLMPNSHAYLVETKCIKGGKPTEPSAIQRWVHKKLARLGFKVWIVNDHDSLNYFLNHINKV